MSPQQQAYCEIILALTQRLRESVEDEAFEDFDLLIQWQQERAAAMVSLFDAGLTVEERQLLLPFAEQLLLVDQQMEVMLRRRQNSLMREHHHMTRKSAAIAAYRLN
jgi:hypothetical protein